MYSHLVSNGHKYISAKIIVSLLSLSAPWWASFQICSIARCACTGNAGNVFPTAAGKRSRHARLRYARAGKHAGIANSWCPLKSVAGKTFLAFPAHAQPAILRIIGWLNGKISAGCAPPIATCSAGFKTISPVQSYLPHLPSVMLDNNIALH